MTLVFGLFSTFMILFYNSNIRVNLISPQLEKPLKTIDDIIERGEAVYVAVDFRETL